MIQLSSNPLSHPGIERTQNQSFKHFPFELWTERAGVLVMQYVLIRWTCDFTFVNILRRLGYMERTWNILSSNIWTLNRNNWYTVLQIVYMNWTCDSTIIRGIFQLWIGHEIKAQTFDYKAWHWSGRAGTQVLHIVWIR